jgi:hypothetical protein
MPLLSDINNQPLCNTTLYMSIVDIWLTRLLSGQIFYANSTLHVADILLAALGNADRYFRRLSFSASLESISSLLPAVDVVVARPRVMEPRTIFALVMSTSLYIVG